MWGILNMVILGSPRPLGGDKKNRQSHARTHISLWSPLRSECAATCTFNRSSISPRLAPYLKLKLIDAPSCAANLLGAWENIPPN